jgi:hypothetical protein
MVWWLNSIFCFNAFVIYEHLAVIRGEGLYLLTSFYTEICRLTHRFAELDSGLNSPAFLFCYAGWSAQANHLIFYLNSISYFNNLIMLADQIPNAAGTSLWHI